jgi:hypothetical protein
MGRGRRVDPPPYPFRHFCPRGNGVPGVTDVIDDQGLRCDYSSIPSDVLRAAGERGDRVHAAIARALTGDPAPDSDLHEGDRGHWEGWLAWRSIAAPRPVLVEHTVLVLSWPQFGGTLDFAGGTSYGDRIIDWKCRQGFHNDGMQTAAYQRGVQLTHPDPEVVQFVRSCERSSVELRKNGTFKIHPHRDALDVRHFVAALITWGLRRAAGWSPTKT